MDRIENGLAEMIIIPSTKLAKRNLICQKTWRPGCVAYPGKANFKNLLLKPVVRIQNNFVELITG